MLIFAGTVYSGLRYLRSLLRRILGLDDVRTDASPKPLQTNGPVAEPRARVRILFLAANTQMPMDLEREFERIDTVLRLAKVREQVELKVVWAVTIDRLMQAMLDEAPTIVHFAGHGRVAGMVLRDDAGSSHVVPMTALASLFSLFEDCVQCVILNACSPDDRAAAAVRGHVPYVIGMRAPVPDTAAIAFSTGFYTAIAAGRDVPFAFRMGVTRVQAEGQGDEDLYMLLEAAGCEPPDGSESIERPSPHPELSAESSDALAEAPSEASASTTDVPAEETADPVPAPG